MSQIASLLESLKGKVEIIAIWVRVETDHPTLALIGVQVEPDTEPVMSMTVAGSVDQARVAAIDLGLRSQETVDAARRVTKWVARPG